jgi:hypothetical protein
MTIFDRDWRITVGTLRVAKPIRVQFEIERSLHSKPGKAKVTLYNLTRDHQSQIERATSGQVIIEAGYVDERGAETLFVGELLRGKHHAKTAESGGVDTMTTVEARDAGRSYRAARVSQSFEPGVSTATVLRACANALGVGHGNLNDLGALSTRSGDPAYPEGIVLAGQASREMTRILAGLGLRWSVQHGAIQILRPGLSLPTRILRLSQNTGLVGSPEITSRGRVKAVALLTPDIWPGRAVIIDSEKTQGRFEIRSTKHHGDSHATDWYAEAEMAAAA